MIMRSFVSFLLVIVVFGNAFGQSPVKRIRVNQGVLKPTHRIDPTYPEGAPTGTVSLRVVIATDGSVKDLQVINGDDQLARSAIKAVKEWRYKPLTINGTAVEVETQIDVKFARH